jgi:hypothetical protein
MLRAKARPAVNVMYPRLPKGVERHGKRFVPVLRGYCVDSAITGLDESLVLFDDARSCYVAAKELHELYLPIL